MSILYEWGQFILGRREQFIHTDNAKIDIMSKILL